MATFVVGDIFRHSPTIFASFNDRLQLSREKTVKDVKIWSKFEKKIDQSKPRQNQTKMQN